MMFRLMFQLTSLLTFLLTSLLTFHPTTLPLDLMMCRLVQTVSPLTTDQLPMTYLYCCFPEQLCRRLPVKHYPDQIHLTYSPRHIHLPNCHLHRPLMIPPTLLYQ